MAKGNDYRMVDSLASWLMVDDVQANDGWWLYLCIYACVNVYVKVCNSCCWQRQVYPSAVGIYLPICLSAIFVVSVPSINRHYYHICIRIIYSNQPYTSKCMRAYIYNYHVVSKLYHVYYVHFFKPIICLRLCIFVSLGPEAPHCLVMSASAGHPRSC